VVRIEADQGQTIVTPRSITRREDSAKVLSSEDTTFSHEFDEILLDGMPIWPAYIYQLGRQEETRALEDAVLKCTGTRRS